MKIEHTALDRTPYTYVIKNLITGKRYYGCRYSKNCHPDEFWKKYFTSSKIIKKLIKEEGIENWVFEIRRIFSDISVCKDWEFTVLRRLGIPKNKNWYNQSIGGKKFLLQGEALEALKKKNSTRLKELNNIPEWKDRFKEIMKIRWSKENAKEKHSLQIKEYWEDPVWYEKVCQDRKDRSARPEVKIQKSLTSLENWKRPEYVENHKAAMKIVVSNPEWLEANRENMRLAWTDPTKRDNFLKNRPAYTEERREKQSAIATEQNKKSWKDPLVRERRIQGIKAAAAKRKAAKIAALLGQEQLGD